MITGWLVDAWAGVPKGDDAFFHLGNVEFLREHFPRIWWYPYSHAGEPVFLSYPLLYYSSLALVSALGLSLFAALRITVALSFVGITVAVYAFARSLKLSRSASAATAGLVLTSNAFWNWTVVGGAYIRVAAIPFFFLSLAAAYWYLEAAAGLREDEGRKRILLIAVLSLCALLHPLVFQFTFLIVVTLLLLGTAGWRSRLQTMARVFLPVGFVIAWQYLPFITTNFLSETRPVSQHDVTPMRWSWLYEPAASGEWSISPGPLLFVIALAGLLYLSVALPDLYRHRSELRLPLALVATTFLWSGYFLVLGWVNMPSSLYLMSAFDHPIWLAMTLTVFTIALFALLRTVSIDIDRWVGRPFLVVTIIAVAITIPWVRSFTRHSDPRSPITSDYAARRAVETAMRKTGDGFRVGAADRVLVRWLPYEHPDVEFFGGRSWASPHRYYYEWMVDEVYHRLDSRNLSFIYFEDRPQVVRGSQHSENFYRSQFWLDWYGSQTAVLNLPFLEIDTTAGGYQTRPHLFDYDPVKSRFGPLAVVEDDAPQGLLVETDAPAVAVPYMKGAAPGYYSDFLEVLSNLDLGPQWIVPIKLDDATDLKEFDAALVDSSTYEAHRDQLDAYAEDGGRVVVTRDDATDGGIVSITTDPGIAVEARATTVDAVADEIFATSDRGPIGACEQIAAGSLCRLGTNLYDLRKSSSAGAPLLLLHALGVPVNPDVVERLPAPPRVVHTVGADGAVASGSMTDLGQTVSTSPWEMTAAGASDDGSVARSGESTRLKVHFGRGTGEHAVGFTSSFQAPVPMGGASFVSFELRVDDPVRLGVRLGRAADRSLLPPTDQWVSYVLPVETFRTSEARAGSLTLSARASTKQGFAGPGDDVTLEVRDLTVVSRATSGKEEVLQAAIDPGADARQVGFNVGLARSIDVEQPGFVELALRSDGTALRQWTITLDNDDEARFEFIFPEVLRWRGIKHFAVPLGAFRALTGSSTFDVDGVELLFKFDKRFFRHESPFEFSLKDMKIVQLGEPAGEAVPASGDWTTPSEYSGTLSQASTEGVLWKESYSPAWEAERDGRAAPHYFAGPGMTWIAAAPVGGGSDGLAVSMPVPRSLIAGLLITGNAAIVGLYLLISRRRRRAKTGPRAVRLDT